MDVEPGYLGEDGVHGGLLRRRAPEDVAVGVILLRVLPGEPGATIPGTERRPGQTGGRARGLIVSPASDPTPASSTKNYHTPTPFSSYRVSHRRHKAIGINYFT